MPAVRSSMRKIKDVLRLKYEAKLSCRQIAASLKLSVGVISKYTHAAEAAGLSWPLPDGMDDTTLEECLFPPVVTVREFAMPDCAHIHQELKRKGVTLMLLWEEYQNPVQAKPTSMRSSACIIANTAAASNSPCARPTRLVRNCLSTTVAMGFLSLIT